MSSSSAKRRVTRSKRDFHTKQFHVLDVDVFKVTVGVAVNMTEAEILKAVREHGASSAKVEEFNKPGELKGWDQAEAWGQMCKLGGGYVVLLRLNKDQFRKAVGTIVHEMTHVAQYLLRERRIPLTEDTEEVHAYLVDYLVQETLNRLYD